MLDFIASIPPSLSGALGFCLGTWAGLHISLAVARRKEFHDFAVPVREKLIEARGRHDMPYYAPTEVEIDRLEAYLWPWQRRRLRAAVAAHRECYETNFHVSEDGHWFLRDADAVAASIEPMLRVIRIR